MVLLFIKDFLIFTTIRTVDQLQCFRLICQCQYKLDTSASALSNWIRGKSHLNKRLRSRKLTSRRIRHAALRSRIVELLPTFQHTCPIRCVNGHHVQHIAHIKPLLHYFSSLAKCYCIRKEIAKYQRLDGKSNLRQLNSCAGAVASGQLVVSGT